MQIEYSETILVGENLAYSVMFSQLPPESFGVEADIPIVDVTITASSISDSFNSYAVLRKFSGIIYQYLCERDIILFYYCDDAEIARRNKELSPQEYRSELFGALIERNKDKSIVSREIKIKGETQNFYSCFISKEKNASQLAELAGAVAQMSK